MPDRPPIDVAALRREYANIGLDERDAGTDPIALFRSWLGAALAVGIPEPNAMVVSTVDEQSRPSSRTVLLKGVDDDGFVFYTNYASRKSRQLEANPAVAAVFGWIAVGRQVTVRGTAAKVSAAESDAYFATRPRGSQLAAWASRQSAPLADRAELDAAIAQAARRFEGGDVPRPAHWGGYRINPVEIEFWQGRADRLHDRLRFVRREGGWDVQRVWP